MIVAAGYCGFGRVVNEVGPVGMDVAGRQIFLQTLETALRDSGVRVTSEWDDTNVLGRLVQEPMRTTIRLIGPADRTDGIAENAAALLRQPHGNLTRELQTIWISENYKVTGQEFATMLAREGVQTLGDALAAMGFRRYEYFAATRLVFAADLPSISRGNIKHVGGQR